MYNDVFTHNKRIDKNVKYIPTFDPVEMETKLIDVQPRYLQSTTSRLLKELPPDDEEILLFKQREQEFLRCQSSASKLRTNLNQKSDLFEFVVNSRTQRLEKYLEHSNTKNCDHPSSKIEEELLINKEKLNYLKDAVVKGEQLFNSSRLKKCKTAQSLSKSKEKNRPVDASRISNILKTVKKKQNIQVFQNKFTEKISKPVEDPFEWIGNS